MSAPSSKSIQLVHSLRRPGRCPAFLLQFHSRLRRQIHPGILIRRDHPQDRAPAYPTPDAAWGYMLTAGQSLLASGFGRVGDELFSLFIGVRGGRRWFFLSCDSRRLLVDVETSSGPRNLFPSSSVHVVQHALAFLPQAQRKPPMPGYARICSNLPCQSLADLSIIWHKNERGAYQISAPFRHFLPKSAHSLLSAAATCPRMPAQ
ncbi:hypothetical protein C8F04DRAFT_1123393 [Mycena alexandri]|uniref:Uncharacterized protein n=1 Tax=Mycena alexandri TaxID=1745969 RepID=A0AAD6SHL2_9AGAR|nr:hypothetical protein C8F04DRAFT_1123393 [Mycena alexandri]